MQIFHDSSNFYTHHFAWMLENIDDVLYSWSDDFPYQDSSSKVKCPDNAVWCEVEDAQVQKPRSLIHSPTR